MYTGHTVPGASGEPFRVGPHIMVVSPHPDELEGFTRAGGTARTSYICPASMTPHGKPQTLHDAGRLAWGSGPRGAAPDYTGLDVIIAHDGKIVALYVFLDSNPT
jgi:hypothetical protein